MPTSSATTSCLRASSSAAALKVASNFPQHRFRTLPGGDVGEEAGQYSGPGRGDGRLWSSGFVLACTVGPSLEVEDPHHLRAYDQMHLRTEWQQCLCTVLFLLASSVGHQRLLCTVHFLTTSRGTYLLGCMRGAGAWRVDAGGAKPTSASRIRRVLISW